MDTLLLALSMYLAMGICAGFLSGLLGAGGGLVMVPGLIFLFQYESMNQSLGMHVAVGTSLAVMIPLAMRSLASHIKYGVSFMPIYKSMAPGIVVGVISGGVGAHFIHSHELEIIFGLFVLVMAFSLLRKHTEQAEANLPGKKVMWLAGAFVGVQSGLLGVGGSAFSVPFLTHRGVNIHNAVAVSIAIAMTVSVLGTITFMFTGMHVTGLPRWSTGYIYWPAWIGLVIGGVLMAPFGVKVSHRVSSRKLKVCFALFLFVVAGQMLI